MTSREPHLLTSNLSKILKIGLMDLGVNFREVVRLRLNRQMDYSQNSKASLGVTPSPIGPYRTDFSKSSINHKAEISKYRK